jgi:hypothetical protein
MGYVVMGVDVCVLCCVVGWKEGTEKGGRLGGAASGGSSEYVGEVLTRSSFQLVNKEIYW